MASLWKCKYKIKPTMRFSENGQFIKEYKDHNEYYLEKLDSMKISMACKRMNKYKDSLWIRSEDYSDELLYEIIKKNERLQNIRKERLQKKYKEIPFYQLDMCGNIINKFSNINQAVAYGFTRQYVLRCLNNEILTHKNCIWIYCEDATEKNILKSINSVKRKYDSRSKKVIAICNKTGNREIYNSIKEASERIYIDKKSIERVLNGRFKTAAGMHWEYAK